jgi:hypothetical protein
MKGLDRVEEILARFEDRKLEASKFVIKLTTVISSVMARKLQVTM